VIGPVPHGVVVQLVVFAAIGFGLLLMAAVELHRWRDADAVLVAAAVLGTFVFVVALNWTVSARNLLPLVPFLAIAGVRRLGAVERVEFAAAGRWAWRATVAMVPISLAVAYADDQAARGARDASDQIRTEATALRRTVWFQGHWGFQYYMQQWGAKPVDNGAHCAAGDLMVIPWDNSNIAPLPARAVRKLGRVAPWQPPAISTFHRQSMAGFYSDRFGPIPFAFGPVKPDRYDLYEAQFNIIFDEPDPATKPHSHE
jgi:hypothetical protein